jgi:hypothetical protein
VLADLLDIGRIGQEAADAARAHLERLQSSVAASTSRADGLVDEAAGLEETLQVWGC